MQGLFKNKCLKKYKEKEKGEAGNGRRKLISELFPEAGPDVDGIKAAENSREAGIVTLPPSGALQRSSRVTNAFSVLCPGLCPH